MFGRNQLSGCGLPKEVADEIVSDRAYSKTNKIKYKTSKWCTHTSNLSPEVECGLPSWQVVSECLEGEVKLRTLLNVEGTAVTLDVLELR